MRRLPVANRRPPLSAFDLEESENGPCKQCGGPCLVGDYCGTCAQERRRARRESAATARQPDPLGRTCQNHLGSDKHGAPLLCGNPATRRRYYWWLCRGCVQGDRWLDASAAGVLLTPPPEK